MQKKFLFLLFMFLVCVNQLFAQIQGIVTDAQTGEPIPFANVFYAGKGVGGITDIDGNFSVESRPEWKNLSFSSVGYDTKEVAITAETTYLKVKLEPHDYSLEEVVVKAKRDKYSRKNNPAVELMKKVVVGKQLDDLKQKDYYSYNSYQKLTLALNHITADSLKESKLFKQYPFFRDQVEYCAEIDKNIKTDADLVGDLKEVLAILNSRLGKQNHTEWVNYIKELKEKYPLRYDDNGLNCPYIMEQIDQVTKGQAIITTDVGQHQMWASQFYHYTKPRTFLSSGGCGTMGYGLGACIGAKMGQPDKICINIGGDGCFRMNMNELATASRYNIPIIQVVINNHVLGMVRQWQTLFYDKRYSQTILDDKVDFCKVAEGLGCEAILVTTREEVAPAIERAISLNKPVVINCMIQEDDKVFPMVPAGAPISEAFDAEDLKNKEA